MGEPGQMGSTMANDLIWSRTQMEEGFDSAEHDRKMLEAHTKTIQTVAQSLPTDSGAGGQEGGSATGSGSAAASSDDSAETPMRRGLMVTRNRVPYQKYMDPKRNGNEMSEKLKIWLGAKETASGYKLVHNLVKRFLTMHGLLLSITVFPDYNKKSQEHRNTLQELGLAKGLSDQEKKPHTFDMEYLFSVIRESVVKS